jgi:hypothetical protein
MRPLVAGLAPFAIALIACLPAHGDIIINEILYQPAGPPENPGREYIELYNSNASPVNVSGWKFTRGVDFTFPNGTTVPANGYLVVAANLSTFQSVYPSVTNVIGSWSGSLANTAEEIRLENLFGEVEDEVTYADSGDWALRIREPIFGGWDWTSAANGGGRSLELRNPNLDNSCGQNWGDSSVAGGTPGSPNSLASTNIAPLITEVNHWPALPASSDKVTISCKLTDEMAAGTSASLFWRIASSTQPGSFQTMPMFSDGNGNFSAELPSQTNLRVIEFYIQATDGTSTRTWPAPTSEGQNANCLYLVSDEQINSTDSYYFVILTAAENSAFNNVPVNSDRQFNQTFIAIRGGEATIRYRSSMRLRGNSSRSYQFKPMRISFPRDNPWDGATVFNLNPRSSYLQHLGFRLFQAAGLRASDTIPVEIRRNGLESATSSGTTPDFGKWVRVEDESGELVDKHWPEASGGNLYKKRRPDRYWRNTGSVAPTNPITELDGWSKQNNSAANDWSDLTTFFARVQTVGRPHFPGAPPNDIAASTGSPTFSNGNWNNTALTSAEITSLEGVADLDQWARWFAVMTIMQDFETNISNGQDDDYGVYFEPLPGGVRRAQLVPHDLDAIFGLGDTTASPTSRGLYDMTETDFIFRPLLPLIGTTATAGNATFKTKYLNAIRELYGSVFNASTSSSPFNAFVDQHLGGWVPTARINQIKNFAAARQTHLLGLIGAPAIPPTQPTSTASINSAHGSLMISEVFANSTGSGSSDAIELHNAGTSAVDLSGHSVSDDSADPQKFVFPAGTSLSAGGYLILQADGGTGSDHLPFTLRDSGGGVYLYGSAASGGALIDSVVYGCQPSNYSVGRIGGALTTWTLCTPTLGAANIGVSSFASPTSVRINEWLGNADYQFESDFIELYNTAAQPAAIGGMSITDDFINYPLLHVLPPLSFIGPSSFLRMEAVGAEATPGDTAELPFRIDGTFGNLALIGQNGAIADRVDVVAQTSDTSGGRSPDGSGSVVRFGLPATIATPGTPNIVPPANIVALMNDLRITEILYRPDNIEYIELQNLGSSTLDLSGVRFTRGITYQFESGATLAPGAFVVVCRDRTAFQNQFGGAVPLAAAQFTGSLSNSGETIGLQLPAPWDACILNFEYDVSWYPATNNGFALNVIDQDRTYAGDWDEKTTWTPSLAAGGTPGVDSPPTITSALAATTIIGNTFQYQITATKRPTSYSATGLPTGLSIDTETGLITGTVSNPGIVNIEIGATNSGGAENKTLVLTILASGPHAAFAWDPIASPQEAGEPFSITIRAVDAQGRTVVGFNGSVSLRIDSDIIIGDGTSSWEYPFGTFYHDARTQSIYLASEIGGPGRITALTLDVTTIPPQILGNWTIRMKHTSLSAFATNQWEGPSSGWITVYQQNESIASTGIVTFVFATPFDYNGTSNLMIDFSFNNSSFTSDGQARYTTTGSVRTLFYQTDSEFGNPLSWSGTTSPEPVGALRIPNIKLVKSSQRVVNPGSSGTFTNGSLSQNVAVSPPGTMFAITANDGAGHSGVSNSFDAVILDAPVITSPATAHAVVGQPFSYQILATAFPDSFNATNLPVNLGVNTSTGLINGTPTTAGTESINLSATNPIATGSAILSLTVQGDNDGDGMGDTWETSYGLNPASAADAGLDKDGDGESNFEEWISGTAPDDPSSRFTIIAQLRVPTGVELTWNSVVGRRYRVLSRTSLTSTSWTDLTPSPIVATGTTTTWIHVNGHIGTSRFYRVEVVR